MFVLWRKFVVWLRTLLLKLARKQPIKWDEEIIEVTEIIHDVVEANETTPAPKLPNYDIIGPVVKPRWRLLDWLRNR